jgi:hypothetical protein
LNVVLLEDLPKVPGALTRAEELAILVTKFLVPTAKHQWAWLVPDWVGF